MKCMVKKLLCCGAKSFSQRARLPEEGRVRVYVGNDRDTQCKLEMDADFLTHPLFEAGPALKKMGPNTKQKTGAPMPHFKTIIKPKSKWGNI
ncbi:hypothetical protein ISN45_Aa01g029330 [Arabidopsis thaliana x Arabidopsis arenosa]|uniref:Uncharacterized protein n=1 Tax=Arabidopsis thaliana x Arabidopsis arenosa TaxID=1240361 RepID=A0A8T2C3L9_9BRAS|nr:hypothetical protein ISN45_Aa01g029330 [Arabidopsis thaliana x Arabidopsis arenosa]